MANEDQIARIQQLERIRALEAKQGGGDPDQPGAQAIGTTDGPTPAATAKAPDWVDKIQSIPSRVGSILQKMHSPMLAPLAVAMNPAVRDLTGRALDYAGGAIRTAGAAGIGAATGNNPVTMGDVGNTLVGQAPGVGDYATRMGMPNPGMDIPGTNGKRLEAKDLVNLIGNTATNPLMYGAAQKFGRRMYNAGIEPIEVEGQRFGKQDVGDELNAKNIATPFKLREKIQPILNRQMKEAGETELAATRSGGEPVMSRAMSPAQEYVNQIMKNAKEGSPQEAMAKEMQAEIDKHLAADAKPMAQILQEIPVSENQVPLDDSRTVTTQTPVPRPELPLMEMPTLAKPGQMSITVPKSADNRPLMGRSSTDKTNRYFGTPVANDGVVESQPLVEKRPAINRDWEMSIMSPEERLASAEKKAALQKLANPDAGKPIDTLGTLPAPMEYVSKTTRPANYVLADLPREGVPVPELPANAPPETRVAAAAQAQADPNLGATPLNASQWKKDAYANAGNASYDSLKRGTPWSGFYKAMGHGLKSELENSIGQSLGPEAQAAYSANNESTGKLLSTGKSQNKVSVQAGRELERASNPLPTMTEGMSGLVGGHGDLLTGGKIAGLLKGLRAARLGMMPAGYVLRNTPIAATQAGVISNELRNPYSKENDNGQ